MTSDLASLEKAALAAQRCGVGGFVCQPHEILKLIEELIEYRKMPRSGPSKDVLIDPRGWPDPCDLYAKTGFPKDSNDKP